MLVWRKRKSEEINRAKNNGEPDEFEKAISGALLDLEINSEAGAMSQDSRLYVFNVRDITTKG